MVIGCRGFGHFCGSDARALLLPKHIDGSSAPVRAALGRAHGCAPQFNEEWLRVPGRKDAQREPAALREGVGEAERLYGAVGDDLGARYGLTVHDELDRNAACAGKACPLQVPVRFVERGRGPDRLCACVLGGFKPGGNLRGDRDWPRRSELHCAVVLSLRTVSNAEVKDVAAAVPEVGVTVRKAFEPRAVAAVALWALRQMNVGASAAYALVSDAREVGFAGEGRAEAAVQRVIPEVELGEGPKVATRKKVHGPGKGDVHQELVRAHAVERRHDVVRQRRVVHDETVRGVRVAGDRALRFSPA